MVYVHYSHLSFSLAVFFLLQIVCMLPLCNFMFKLGFLAIVPFHPYVCTLRENAGCFFKYTRLLYTITLHNYTSMTQNVYIGTSINWNSL